MCLSTRKEGGKKSFRLLMILDVTSHHITIVISLHISYLHEITASCNSSHSVGHMSTEAVVSKYGTWQSRCVVNGRNYATWNVASIVDFQRQPLVLVLGKRYCAKTTLIANNIVRDVWPYTKTVRVYSSTDDHAQWTDLLMKQGLVTCAAKQVDVRQVVSPQAMLEELVQLCDFQKTNIEQRGQVRDANNMVTVVFDDVFNRNLIESQQLQRFLHIAPHLNILVVCGIQYFMDIPPRIRVKADWVACAHEHSLAIRTRMVDTWAVESQCLSFVAADMNMLMQDMRYVVFGCRREGGVLTIRSDKTTADTKNRYEQAELYVQTCAKFEAPLWRTILDESIPVRDLCDIVASYIRPDWSMSALNGLHAQEPSVQSIACMRRIVQITYHPRDDNVSNVVQDREDAARIMSTLSNVVHAYGDNVGVASAAATSAAASALSQLPGEAGLIDSDYDDDDDDDNRGFTVPPGGMSTN